MIDPDTLIDALSGTATPVRRVLPTWMRALVVIPAALALGYLASTMLHRSALGWTPPYAGLAAANIALSMTLGATAIVCALSMSVAGRLVRARGWMVAALLAWLALAALCIGRADQPVGSLGQGSYCFTFVLVAGLPMMLVVIPALRQTGALRPVRSLIAAGAGIAFLSFGLLALCHPVAMSLVDFVAHLIAAMVVAGLTTLLGRGLIAA